MSSIRKVFKIMAISERKNDASHILISIDGGGTKTEICACDLKTNRSMRMSFGGSNYKIINICTVRDNLLNGLMELCNQFGIKKEDISFCLMGLSGCDTEEDRSVYKNIMSGFRIMPSRIVICNDSEMIYRSLTDDPGLCIVAGTGSVVFGFSESNVKVRSGGWGAPISDRGSGYWIGAEVIRRYIDWIDGIGEWNEFFKEIKQIWGCGEPQITAARLACLDYVEVASLAKLVLNAARNGNLLCRKIIDESTGIISKLAASAYSKLGVPEKSPITVVESGSLFHDQYFEMGIQKNFLMFSGALNVRFLKVTEAPAKFGISYAKKLYTERFGKIGD